MNRLRLAFLPLTALAFLSLPLSAQAPRIFVGPNVLVSQDGGVAHAELHIAAHPTDPQRLIGMATTVRDAASKVTLELYATDDGGFTWKGSVPSHLLDKGAFDPIVGYGLHGTPLGVALGDRGMWVYRSEDGGFTWDNGVRAGNGDHERMGVDHSSGRYAGRMYLASEVIEGRSASPDTMSRAAHVWRSEDDGRSWIGPVTVARDMTHGITVQALTVLSDGTVALFLSTYPNPSRDTTTQSWKLQLVTSTDGGVTFSAPRPIGEHRFGGYADFRRKQRAGRVDLPGGFDAAVDAKSTRFHDRLYMVYSESRPPNEGARLVFRSSSDRGATWTMPRDIVPESRTSVSQFQPAIAVNADGTVGIMWYDTRDVAADGWNLYFTASSDGGETWATPVRVSSEPTVAFSAANDRPVPLVVRQAPAGITVAMLSAFSRWPTGGEYMGLTADASGVFHPFWVDGRSGLFEVYTSRIQVLPSAGLVAVAQGTTSDTTRHQQTLNEKVTLDFDPASVDWQRSEILVPVRLRNTSSDTLYGPFTVRLTRLGGQPLVAAGGVTEILNASNGQRREGAEFDFTPALRDVPYLAPHAVTEAITWRVKPASMRHTDLNFTATVLGFARR
jgi:BNR repeat-like domain